MRDWVGASAGALAVLSVWCGVSAGATEYKFDMGTAKSPVWEGCARVSKETRYDAKRGYGWATKEKVYDCHRVAVDNRGKLSIPDDLWGDLVLSSKETAFRVDVPNGRYEVVLLIGDIGSAYGPHGTKVRGLYPTKTIVVKVNGAEVIKEVIDENNLMDVWLQNENTEYRKGDCPWRKYINPKFQPRSFWAEAKEGKLVVELGPDVRVAGMFVHPAGKRGAFKRWYAAQTEPRRAFFLSRYYEVKHEPIYGPLEPTRRERARGYATFSRSYLEEVYPNSTPAKDEHTVRSFDLTAARGESEPVTFSVIPLKDLKAVRVNASVLKGPRGARIPAAAWDIRHVRYMQLPPHAVVDKEMAFSVRPRLLDRVAAKDFEEGTVRRVWLTLRVPGDARAGEYKGRVTFRPTNAAAESFTVRLRVLPFELREPPDVAIGIFYNPGSPWRYFPGKKDIYFDDIKSSLRLLREHGFNSVAYSITRPRAWVDEKDGKMRADLSEFDRFFKAFEAAGMNMQAPFCLYGNDGGSNLIRVQPNWRMGWLERQGEQADEYINDAWVTKFRELLRYQVAYGKERGWPPLVFCVHDEVGGWSRKRLEGTAKIIEATYMQEPEVKTAGCINSPEGTFLAAYHDYPMYNVGVPFTEEYLGLIEKHGKTLAIDNFGQNRWSIGFWMWRIQPKIAADSFFCWIGGAPYNPFDDAVGSELAVALPGRDGWVPTPRLPRMREGIDDYKYAYTLREALREAEANGGDKRAIARGRETLAHLDRFVKKDIRLYRRAGLPSQEVMDGLRRRVASDIAALRGTTLQAAAAPAAVTTRWGGRRRYRLPIRAEAGLYTRRDTPVHVELDLKALAAATGLGAIDPDSIRLVEADKARTPTPFGLREEGTAAEKRMLIWKLSGKTPALTTRSYYRYFGGTGSGSATRPKNLVLKLTEPIPEINLLQNAGFEEVAEDGRPLRGWKMLDTKRLTEGHSMGTTTEEKMSGRYAFKVVQTGKMDRKKARTVATHQHFPVLPGRRYRLSGWLKRSQGTTHNEIMLWWNGEHKRVIGNMKFDAYSKGKHEWRYVEAVRVAPPMARFAYVNLFISSPSSEGTLYFDDISVVMLSQEGHAMPKVVLGEAEERNAE